MNPTRIDGGNQIDWGRTSADYSEWRPNYPDRFYDALTTFDVGLSGQDILDSRGGGGFVLVAALEQRWRRRRLRHLIGNMTRH